MDNSLYASLCADALAPLRAWTIVLAIVGIAAVAICIIALARTPRAVPEQQSNVTTQLKSLHDLHSAGALTEDEYAAAKKRLLATEGSGYGN